MSMLKEVCDLPYFTEPMMFYEKRMRERVTVGQLRAEASRLFQKDNSDLSVDDLKFIMLKLFPFPVEINGSQHKVSVKKYNREWILSCDCGAWVFNHNGRTCKHTEEVKQILAGE